tara:strand:- start:5835 stop:6053 length:219 start_codon:yes stop_codon:yes gene_type:complete
MVILDDVYKHEFNVSCFDRNNINSYGMGHSNMIRDSSAVKLIALYWSAIILLAAGAFLIFRAYNLITRGNLL